MLDMDEIDRQIAEIIQQDGRISNADIAARIGVSVSTASERVRKLVASGAIRSFQGILDPAIAGARLCCFILIDMEYFGEAAACEALVKRPEVMELHHISGAHSYLMKVRVADTDALQAFLQAEVKPLPAIKRTETVISLDALKETGAMKISGPDRK